MATPYIDIDLKARDRLAKYKRWVKESYQDFEPNCERYHWMKSFIFRTNLTTEDQNDLGKIGKPALQFNVLESLISRNRGEFAKQEPSFVTQTKPDVAPVPPQTVETVEGHLMSMLQETKSSLVEFNTFTDQVAGGFSVLELYTEYENDYTFNQRIGLRKAYEPTMCGFDPTARLPHKGDGKYAWQVFPMSEEDLKEKYPDIDLDGITTGALNDFCWSYKSKEQKIIMICDLYVKTTKRKQLLELSTGKAVFKKDYLQAIEDYKNAVAKGEELRAAPSVVNKRWVNVATIERCRFIQNQILEEDESIFTGLPLIFVDGNSQYLRDSSNSDLKQYTRPWFYQAIDAQKLMNVAGQSLCNGLENMVQHKMKVAIEGIPSQYLENYTNIQKPSNYIYKAYKDDGVTPIPPPQEVQMMPLPPEVASTFMQMPQMIQGIVGSFEASLGLNQDDLSGIAMMESITQTNSATMPYIVNFMAAWNQVAQLTIDIMPIVYSNKRSLAVVDKKGKRTYANINGHQGSNIHLNYPPGALGVVVEAGMNFEVQKQKTVKFMGILAQAFPAFAQLINEKGLPILLDNIDCRGVEQLKQAAEQQMQEMAQQKQSSQGTPNPMMMKAQADIQRNQITAQKNQSDAQIASTKNQNEFALGQEKVKNEKIDIILKHKSDQQDKQIDLAKLAIEREDNHHNVILKAHEVKNKKVDTALKGHDMANEHAHQMLDRIQQMTQPQEETGKDVEE